MKPGIYTGLSNEKYHSGPGLSSSDLKQLLKSPRHFQAYKNTRMEPTAEMRRGTLVHALILEPDSFHEQFAIGEFSVRRGKEYEKFCSDNHGKIIISKSEFEEASIAVNSFTAQVEENPTLKSLLVGERETSFYWEDAATGVLCKARPDILTQSGIIVDIKTIGGTDYSNASFDSFQKRIVDHMFHVSAAHYLNGVSNNSRPAQRFIFVVIEMVAPYAVAVFELGPQALQFGAQLTERAIELFAESIATDTWGGYSKEIVEIELPNWALYKTNNPRGVK